MNKDTLRKTKPGNQPKWTPDEIALGLEYFKEINGRYPTALEIDKFEYLPSSRSIQRSHNGLIAIREKIGFQDFIIDYTKGAARSNKAKATYKNSVETEFNFYNFLISKVPEVRVHEHKILRPGNVCCDFFIYTSEVSGYAIDIFYAQDLFSVREVIRNKTTRYVGLPYKTYFILVGNDKISDEEIQTMLLGRKTTLPKHIHIATETKFKREIDTLI